MHKLKILGYFVVTTHKKNKQIWWIISPVGKRDRTINASDKQQFKNLLYDYITSESSVTSRVPTMRVKIFTVSHVVNTSRIPTMGVKSFTLPDVVNIYAEWFRYPSMHATQFHVMNLCHLFQWWALIRQSRICCSFGI